MFSRYSLRALIFLYFLLAGVTWVSGSAGQGILGRVALADVLGLLIVFFALLVVFKTRKGMVIVPTPFRLYMPFFLVLVLSVVFSDYPEKGLIEVLVHLYIFIVSLSLFVIFVQSKNLLSFEDILGLILGSGAVLSAIGLVQFLFLPNLFQGAFGGLSGTFRNTGQAGAFFALYIGIIVPGFLAGLIRPSLRNFILLLVIVLALILTFKRAAWIGLLIGFVLLVLRMSFSRSARDKKFAAYGLILIFVLAPVVLGVFSWAIENVNGMAWRFQSKISQDAGEDFIEGFFMENVHAMWLALVDNPIFGAGAANVAGVYTTKYEIHSTYMKIVATTGLVGTAFYLVFMSGFSVSMLKVGSLRNKYSEYLRYVFPFFVGMVVSWAYTYHLRKREFWIFFAVVCFCLYLSRRVSRNEINLGRL
ncbi:MAG: O-antigen ligase family protein [Marinobacter sp.]|uniref:O-antigen ligase family protein n=2 Tax=Marinobacter sp. TaxID=50741 RepID=UPI00329A17E4